MNAENTIRAPHLGLLMSGLNRENEKAPKELQTGDKWSGSFGGGTAGGTLGFYVFDYTLVMTRDTENRYALTARCMLRPPLLSGEPLRELATAEFQGQPEEELSAAENWLNARIGEYIAAWRPELAK